MKSTLSIVSHNSGAQVDQLLGDLHRLLPAETEIILTINVPEDERFLRSHAGLPITVLRNVRPLGFGANHNQAFAVSRGQAFIIVNPDVRLNDSPFDALAGAMSSVMHAGACAPVVVAPDGNMEDSVRRFPSVLRLVRRVVLGRRSADYDPRGKTRPISIDWAAGMFVMFDRAAFVAVGGFDTRYFMYFEDADVCRRLHATGWDVLLTPDAQVVHAAQRASRRSARHLSWHLRSALRFLTGV